MLLVFVESYGRVAVEDSSFSPGVHAVLDDGTRRLRAAGYSSRSAFLTSPTFGAASWLAHATLQSGLWVDSQQRYDQLLRADRLTLTEAFGRAGWRTVADVPANTKDWPEGEAFYGFDQMYDSRNVGYEGPEFGYASMPDQYTLEHFRRTELAPTGRDPVMAEIDLVSSHHPWTPLPQLVPWDQVGDGSVFDGMPERGEPSDVVFRDPDAVRRLRRVDRVHLGDAGLVPGAAVRPGPRARRARRPPAALLRQRRRRRPRRTGQRDRAGPDGAAADRRLGLAGRAAARARRPGLADGRVPRPLPLGVRQPPH